MASEFDESDFIDRDFQSSQKASQAAPPLPAGPGGRPPTREELDTRVGETQQRLAELKRIQEELERERSALEEARRRRVELQTGREEVLQHLARGIGLLEEAEFAARRDAEQMARTLGDFRLALEKVQAIHEETWTQESWQMELTRALTTIENARMEWNSARMKWPVLDGTVERPSAAPPAAQSFASLDFPALCRIGLAFTWPLALILLAGFVLLLALRS